MPQAISADAALALAFAFGDNCGLLSSGAEARELALQTLEALASLGQAEAEELISGLQRSHVQRLLATQGQLAASEMAVILQQKNFGEQSQLEQALGALVALGAEALEALATTLRTGSTDARELAAQAFIAAGRQSERYAGHLAAALEDSSATVRRRSAESLSRMGRAALQ